MVSISRTRESRRDLLGASRSVGRCGEDLIPNVESQDIVILEEGVDCPKVRIQEIHGPRWCHTVDRAVDRQGQIQANLSRSPTLAPQRSKKLGFSANAHDVDSCTAKELHAAIVWQSRIDAVDANSVYAELFEVRQVSGTGRCVR